MKWLSVCSALAMVTAACSSNPPVRAPLPGDATAGPAELPRTVGVVPGSTSPRAEMNALPKHVATVDSEERRGLAAVRDPQVASAPPPGPSQTGSRTDPDNRPIRERAVPDAPPTSRSNADPDLRLVQQIRSAVVSDDSLSFSAKSVKVIAVEGKVTLRGSVENEREWNVLDEQARRVAGAGNVDNQVRVGTRKR